LLQYKCDKFSVRRGIFRAFRVKAVVKAEKIAFEHVNNGNLSMDKTEPDFQNVLALVSRLKEGILHNSTCVNKKCCCVLKLFCTSSKVRPFVKKKKTAYKYSNNRNFLTKQSQFSKIDEAPF